MATKKKAVKLGMAKSKPAKTKADGKNTKHFMLFEVSSKEPIKLNMKVIEYIPGKKAVERKVLVQKKLMKGKGKSQEDEIINEIFDGY